MEDPELSRSLPHEGVFSIPREKSSCSSIDSTHNQTTTKYGYRNGGPDLRRSRRSLIKIRKLRDKLFRSRLRLKEKRIELQDERNAVSELDTKFMKAIRQFWQQDISIEKSFLEKIYQQLEEKRDEIGSLQYEYDQAEDEHEAVEAQLEREESLTQSSLSRNTDQGIDQRLDIQSTIGTSQLSEPSLVSYEKDEHSETPYQRYQSRVGDARIMRERLQEFSIELSRRAATAKTMAILGLGSGLNDSTSTYDLKAVYSKTEVELKRIEKDLDDWGKGAKEATIPHLKQLSLGTPQAIACCDNTPIRSSPYLCILNHPKSNRPRSPHTNVDGVRPRFKKWIVDRFSRSPENAASTKAAFHNNPSSSMDDRLWAQHVLRSSAEFGEISSSKYGDWASSRSLSIKDRWTKRSRLLMFYSSKALKAVYDCNVQFPPLSLQFKKQSEVSWSNSNRRNIALKDEILEVAAFSEYESFDHHEVPYKDDTLDLDMFSEYESRSV